MNSKKPSTVAWIISHLGYPLLPVVLEAGIRLVTEEWRPDFDTLNAATLAMSVGIIAVFVNQSIRSDKPELPDAAEVDLRNAVCTLFIGFGIVFFVLFGLVVLLHALVVDRQMAQLEPLRHAFQLIVYAGWTVPVFSAVAAQRSFGLRASLV